MAIGGVLIRRKCGDKWGATLWDPRRPDLLALKSKILKFPDFRHFGEVTSTPNGPWASKWVLGFPPKARGFRSRGLRRKYILKNDPPHKILETEQPSFFVKFAIFLCLSMVFFFPHPPPHSSGPVGSGVDLAWTWRGPGVDLLLFPANGGAPPAPNVDHCSCPHRRRRPPRSYQD